MSAENCPTANTRWGEAGRFHSVWPVQFMNKWQHRNEAWKCTKAGLCAQLTADLHSFVSSFKALIFPCLIALPHNGGCRTADVTDKPKALPSFSTKYHNPSNPVCLRCPGVCVLCEHCYDKTCNSSNKFAKTTFIVIYTRVFMLYHFIPFISIG